MASRSRNKGKRLMAKYGGFGGSSSKKTRSNSAGEALHRLADLRMKSMESMANKDQEKAARGTKATLDVFVQDGHPRGGALYEMARDLFHDHYWSEFFFHYCETAEEHTQFVERNYYKNRGSSPPPPPNCGGGATGFDGWFSGGGCGGFGGRWGGGFGGCSASFGPTTVRSDFNRVLSSA
uniref:Uncharacterized protein n=1 Tax=Oryza brachyantha TaxID=4533 RepID=J3MSU1_ORYBR